MNPNIGVNIETGGKVLPAGTGNDDHLRLPVFFHCLDDLFKRFHARKVPCIRRRMVDGDNGGIHFSLLAEHNLIYSPGPAGCQLLIKKSFHNPLMERYM